MTKLIQSTQQNPISLLRRGCFRSLLISTCFLSATCTSMAQESAPTKPDAVAADDPLIPKSFDGEEDFEEATRLRLNVDSVETLKEIIALGESALKKGLDEADQESAKKMISACYVQKTAEAIARLRDAKQMPKARINKLFNDFIEDLGKAIEYDPMQLDAYLMKVEIHAKRNERNEARQAANDAVEKAAPQLDSSRASLEDKAKLSKLYLMRAGLQEEPDDIAADLKKSLRTNPNNTASVILLAKTLIENEKMDEAISYFQSILEISPDNELLIRSTAELLASNKDRLGEALTLLDAKIKLLPKSVELLKTRARVYSAQAVAEIDPARQKEKLALAEGDLNRSHELSKEDIEVLLTRARILLQSKRADEAKKDVDAAIEIDPNRVAAIELRSMVASEQKRFADAINDLLLLIKNEPKDAPKNPILMMRLGILYVQDNRHSQAIKIYDQVIRQQPELWEPYRFRGDARLSVFDYRNAIADFEKALELLPDDEDDRSGILNNLSWVLSTSDVDGVRDGERSLKLALEACELTKYGKQHILSTLAAAYAEVGQFDKAMEWSEKAVQLATEHSDEQLGQYKEELESYKANKPWREKMESKENKIPIAPADAGVET